LNATTKAHSKIPKKQYQQNHRIEVSSPLHCPPPSADQRRLITHWLVPGLIMCSGTFGLLGFFTLQKHNILIKRTGIIRGAPYLELPAVSDVSRI
jgi:hypothetical protein